MLEGLKCFLTLQSGMQKKEECISLAWQSLVGLCPTAARVESLQRGEQTHPGNGNEVCSLRSVTCELTEEAD